MENLTNEQKMARWRLILGPQAKPFSDACLGEGMRIMDAALAAIYDGDTSGKSSSRQGGTGKGHMPNLAKWLVDVRRFFPEDVVSVIQTDAIERKGLTSLLFEPETLKHIKPDISMVSTLMALKGQIPAKSKAAARELVRAVVDEIMQRLDTDLRRAVTGALNRREHSPIRNFSAMDWKRTISSNLKHFDPKTRQLFPEKFYFFERRQRQKAWTVILDIDQSGSMCESIIYASVMGSIFASLPALDTHVVVFDTEVTDLTELCRNDPVDMLFGVQLGGGTDINTSVAYCRSLITDPRKTLFILISDLYEGGVRAGLLRQMEELQGSGVSIITLLALSDSGKPSYDMALAKDIAKRGIACFACSPDRLPDLVAAAIKGTDLVRFQHDFKDV